MNIYLYRYYNNKKIKNAAGKAPNDIYEICEKLGWKDYGIINPREEKNIFLFFRNHLRLKKQFNEIQGKNANYILYQSPMFGSFYNKYILSNLSKCGVKVVTLIHDIDGLRFFASLNEKKKKREFDVYNHSDYIICHNDKMKAYLVEKGINEHKIVSLECFDYLCSNLCKNKQIRYNSIAIAGNLNPIKCGYIYKMIEANQNLHIDLYGVGYESNEKNDNVEYHGSFLPEELPNEIDSMFGLVWDGGEISSCVGEYGNYLRYNNPHKLSLYMASGIPVIVWNQSAIADFVEKYHVGIKVNNLNNIKDKINTISVDQYNEMKNNVEKIQQKVIHGEFFKTAINTIMENKREE